MVYPYDLIWKRVLNVFDFSLLMDGGLNVAERVKMTMSGINL